MPPLLIHQCVFDGLQLALQRSDPLVLGGDELLHANDGDLDGIDAVVVDAVRRASIAAMVAAMTAAMAEIAAVARRVNSPGRRPDHLLDQSPDPFHHRAQRSRHQWQQSSVSHPARRLWCRRASSARAAGDLGGGAVDAQLRCSGRLLSFLRAAVSAARAVPAVSAVRSSRGRGAADDLVQGLLGRDRLELLLAAIPAAGVTMVSAGWPSAGVTPLGTTVLPLARQQLPTNSCAGRPRQPPRNWGEELRPLLRPADQRTPEQWLRGFFLNVVR